MKYIFRKFRSWILLIVLTLAVIIYNEVLIYHMGTWNKIQCQNQTECVHILLVADPQLIGNKNEPLHFLTPISIWDSDTFLRKTFSRAYSFVKPDVVIYLGDLFDEGSTAEMHEFFQYSVRFHSIFAEQVGFYSQDIYLPGDNDIGGEHFDLVTREKVDRFENTYHQKDTIMFSQNLTFYKVNKLMKKMPKLKRTKVFFDINSIRVVLSHVPLIFHPNEFTEKVLNKFQPHILFAAHTHNSMIVTIDGLVQTDRQIIPVTPESPIFSYTLGYMDMYEIIVPTCSYRMGTFKIGYGHAVIENDKLHYTVLWSPSRFHQLINYLILCIFIVIYLLYIKFRRWKTNSNLKTRFSYR